VRAPLAGGEVIEDLADQAAAYALLEVLGNLRTFQGRITFTSLQFAVLHAAVAIPRTAWWHREVHFDDTDLLVVAPSPAGYAEAADFLTAIGTALTSTRGGWCWHCSSTTCRWAEEARSLLELAAEDAGTDPEPLLSELDRRPVTCPCAAPCAR
jgi:hypothetical protein